MENKFKIGSVWRTRGGWRAVVVRKDSTDLTVWHQGDCEEKGWVRHHNIKELPEGNSFDLIEPWKEPVVHEGWVNIYKQGSDRNLGYHFHETRANADKCASCVISRIACIKIKFTEGEGL